MDVFHVDIAAFLIAVERVIDAGLRDRPVVVAQAGSARAVVLDASPEAWGEGIYKGMPLVAAERACRGLRVVLPHPDLYDRATRALSERLSRFAPVIEPGGQGHFYLDMTGTGRLFGPPIDAAARIKRELAGRVRLDPAIGVAANKLVAKVASRVAKLAGIREVLPGEEERFLAPLRVSILPGIGPKAISHLEELSVRQVGDLAALSREQLVVAFGPFGIDLWRRARGIDASPVATPDEAAVVREEAVLVPDTNDDAVVLSEVLRAVERGARRLRETGLVARRVRVTIDHSDGVRSSRKADLLAPSALDPDLFEPATEALRLAFARRVRVRHVEVALERLAPPSPQLELFPREPDQDRAAALVAALDRLRSRFGDRPRPRAVAEGAVPPRACVEGAVPPRACVEGAVPPRACVEGAVPPRACVEGAMFRQQGLSGVVPEPAAHRQRSPEGASDTPNQAGCVPNVARISPEGATHTSAATHHASSVASISPEGATHTSAAAHHASSVASISPEGAPQDSQGRSPWNNVLQRKGSPERATHLEE